MIYKLFTFYMVTCFFFPKNLSVKEENYNYMHGMAMHGDLKYKKNFKNFEYSNPDAPKKGKIKLSAIGTFDNLNPYILKGVAAYQTSYLFETLMKSSFDEPFSQYGLLAEKVMLPDHRKWVRFKLRNFAKFSDGTKVTSDDVIF